MKYSDVTQEMFDNGLEKILSEMTGADLLLVPGIYEVVSEHFNNDVLDAVVNNCYQCRGGD